MKKNGFILLNRDIISSRWFPNPLAFKIFIWLLLKARWIDGFIGWDTGNGIITIELKRGQLAIGRNKAAEALEMPPSTFYSHIKKMEKHGSIRIESTKSYSIITLVNYDRYQNIDNLTKGEDEEVVPKKLKASPGHSFRDTINRKTIQQKQQELRQAFDSFIGNFDKAFLEEKYNELSKPCSNNLKIVCERIKDFNLEKHLIEGYRYWKPSNMDGNK